MPHDVQEEVEARQGHQEASPGLSPGSGCQSARHASRLDHVSAHSWVFNRLLMYYSSTEHRGTSKKLRQLINPDMRLHVSVIFFDFRADSPCDVEHVEVV